MKQREIDLSTHHTQTAEQQLGCSHLIGKHVGQGGEYLPVFTWVNPEPVSTGQGQEQWLLLEEKEELGVGGSLPLYSLGCHLNF